MKIDICFNVPIWHIEKVHLESCVRYKETTASTCQMASNVTEAFVLSKLHIETFKDAFFNLNLINKMIVNIQECV